VKDLLGFGTIFVGSPLSVFRKREALLHHYVPDFLPHRQKELEMLKGWFEPVLSEKVNVKVHVYGPIGTGKTVLCNRLGKYLVDEAKRRGVNLKFVNVNLAYTPKPYYVMSSLMERVVGNPGLGLGPEEMLINIVRRICSEDAKLVVALDEVDTYIMEKRDPKILYMLPRVHELDPHAAGRISLIYISRSLKWLERLDKVILDTLGRVAGVKLEKYGLEEIEDILGYRVEEAFQPAAVSPEIVEFTAQIAYSCGGIRYALELLLGAGMTADSEGSSTVKADHVRRVHASIPKGVNGAIYPDQLSIHKQMLLKAVMEGLRSAGTPYLTFKEAYDLYAVECELQDREAEDRETIQSYLQDLYSEGYVLLKRRDGEALVGMEHPFDRLHEALEKVLSKALRCP